MFATRIVITSVTALALTLLVSCGKKEESKTSATTAPSAPPPVAQPTPPPAAPAAPQAAAPATGAPALARSDGEKPGLSVEVTELKRGSGGTVMLKFVLVNNSKEQISLGYDYGDGSTGDISSVGGTHLMDAVNKKKYLVVRDSEKKCVCSRMTGYIPVGERANLWAKFPAPPDDVKVISIVIPHFAPMDDVPISN